MKKISCENLKKEYIKCGIIAYETTYSGDYRKHNKQYDKIIEIYKYLEKNIDTAKEIFPMLLKHENVEVRGIVCSHCLGLGIYIEEAEKKLREIANNEKNGIFSFNAKILLKVWKEGKLNIYPKSKK